MFNMPRGGVDVLEEDFSSSTTETPKPMVYGENCQKRRIERSTKPNKRIFLSLHYGGTWKTLGHRKSSFILKHKKTFTLYETTWSLNCKWIWSSVLQCKTYGPGLHQDQADKHDTLASGIDQSIECNASQKCCSINVIFPSWTFMQVEVNIVLITGRTNDSRPPS